MAKSGWRRREWIAMQGIMPLAAAQRDTAGAPPEQRRLSSQWPAEKLAQALLPRDRWQPYPPRTDRAAWQGLPAEVSGPALEAGEKALKGAWEVLPATLFLEFRREGNRSRYEGVRNGRRNRLAALTVAECIEGKGRFLDEIANGIWLTCEETWWGVPAHAGAQKRGVGLPDATEPIIDLFAAETAAQLAWTSYLLGSSLDQVSALLRERIQLEIERRILEPYWSRDDFGWMGFRSRGPVNNWNPWINSNCLTSTLLMERDPARRAAFTAKILRSLDRFLDGYHEDGGCDEGPGYWGRAGASLFDCLELLDLATNGQVRFWNMPLVQEIGRYIYRVHIAEDWFVNFADASAKPGMAGPLMYHYGKRIQDARLTAFGAWAQRRRTARSDSLGRWLPAMFSFAEMRKAEAFAPLVAQAWLSGIQVMTARSREGSTDGWFVAAQGGHNAESHNHNDVGNFVAFKNGSPVLIDIGVETYTAKTFSSQRYEIWTMQSGYHNCPTVNNVMQSAGREFAARDVRFRSEGDQPEMAMEIAGAYPREAGLEGWLRKVRLERARGRVVVEDEFRLRASAAPVVQNLITPCEVRAAGSGAVELSGGLLGPGVTARLSWQGPPAELKVEEKTVEDGRLRPIWGDKIRRLQLIARTAGARWALELA